MGDRTKEALEAFADSLVPSAGMPHAQHGQLVVGVLLGGLGSSLGVLRGGPGAPALGLVEKRLHHTHASSASPPHTANEHCPLPGRPQGPRLQHGGLRAGQKGEGGAPASRMGAHAFCIPCTSRRLCRQTVCIGDRRCVQPTQPSTPSQPPRNTPLPRPNPTPTPHPQTPQVPGTLHFTARAEGHSFDHAWMNMTHAVHQLYFGTRPSSRKL